MNFVAPADRQETPARGDDDAPRRNQYAYAGPLAAGSMLRPAPGTGDTELFPEGTFDLNGAVPLADGESAWATWTNRAAAAFASVVAVVVGGSAYLRNRRAAASRATAAAEVGEPVEFTLRH
jgi:hypothetical protein